MEIKLSTKDAEKNIACVCISVSSLNAKSKEKSTCYLDAMYGLISTRDYFHQEVSCRCYFISLENILSIQFLLFFIFHFSFISPIPFTLHTSSLRLFTLSSAIEHDVIHLQIQQFHFRIFSHSDIFG